MSSHVRSHRTVTTSAAPTSPSASSPLPSLALPTSLYPLPLPPPSSSSPLSPLRSHTHSFTVLQFDVYRLFALLATCAAANQFGFLGLLSSHIPLGYEEEAAEGMLPVQVFAGIPKTIEGMGVVRAETDRRKEWAQQGRLDAEVRGAREQARAEIVRVLGEEGAALTARWPTYDDRSRAPPPASLSLSPAYPSLPARPSAPPSSADPNPTALRIARGRAALDSVYSSQTAKLLASLHHLHPSLHHAVLEHIYGAVLCSARLPLQCVELISMACLMGERCGRQLFSHVRGGLMNGCTRAMCVAVLRDAERVYREAARRDAQAGWGWVEDAMALVRRIDRKVNPNASRDSPTSPQGRDARIDSDDGDGGSPREDLAARARSVPPILRRSQSLPSSAKL